MRTALALLGVMWVIVAAAFVYEINHRPAPIRDTMQAPTSPPLMTMTLTSTAFSEGASIPAKYTCDGEQVNPPLSISGVPQEARSLALVMDDPDVPKQLKPDGVFDHWILFNIPPETKEIAMGMTVGTAGKNGAGKNQYAGPCPPPQYEPSTHRYVFRVYALDTLLSLGAGATKQEVLDAMQGHILAQAELVGRYKRE